MVSENQISLYLYRDNWFTPSKSPFKKDVVDENGKKITVPKSYYRNISDDFQILIRVSDHGTHLRTWLGRTDAPENSVQNLSLIFSDLPVSSGIKTYPRVIDIDDDGKAITGYTFFVVEQYIYHNSNLSFSNFKKVINVLKGINPSSVFHDPFRKKPNKKANRTVLKPTDENGDYLPSTTNTVHPRQKIVADNPDYEIDAEGNIITEQKLRCIIRECIRMITNYTL